MERFAKMSAYNNMTRILSVLILLIAGGAANGQHMPPTLIETEPVKELTFHDQVSLTGRTRAFVHSKIVAEVSGSVASIDVSVGRKIDRSAPLMTIDAARLKLSHQSKEAEAKQALVRAELAKTNLARIKELRQQNLVSEGTLDSAHALAESQRQFHVQLEADRQKLAIDVDRCTIRAPFGGYTIRQLVDVGEWVKPGTPVYEMVDLSRVRITVDLPERHFGHLAIGSQATIQMSGDNQEPIEGTVTGIAPSASEITHTFPITIVVDNSNGRLGGGMLVTVVLSLDKEFTSLAVSKDAIVRKGLQTMVYTVTDGKASPITVITGSTLASMIAVKGEGLKAGMPVVVRGNERIFPGSPVRTAGGPPPGGQPPATEEKAADSAETERES